MGESDAEPELDIGPSCGSVAVYAEAAGCWRLCRMRITRYFHYLSKAKVDMLYDQLEMSPSSRSTRVGFDLKVVTGGHEVQQTAQQPSMYDKLRAVEEAIERSEPPGSVEEPQPYIRDRADLWSIVLPSRFSDTESGSGGETVLYCGESRGGRPFVLGGAASHMQPVGQVSSGGLNSNFFYLQREILAFVGALNTGQQEVSAHQHEAFDARMRDHTSDDWGVAQEPLDVEPFMYDSIKYLAELHRTNNNRLAYVGYSEFLARVVRVVHPESARWSPCAVLATPLYVCQIETSGRLQW